MSDHDRRVATREGFIAGALASIPLVAGVIGWANHWNVYTNLILTISGIIFLWVGIAVTLDRYQKTITCSGPGEDV